MTAVMSYQYPPVPQGPDDDTNQLRALGVSAYPQRSSHIAGSPSGASHGAADESKDKQIRKAMSSPNVRKQAQAEAMSAEKRRNKLGYHRTSVACGHCRRRKIRCIPAPNDPQSRCSNCIRLKKECTFFPVDQPPSSTGDNSRRDSKAKSFSRDSLSPPSGPGHPQDLHGSLSYSQLQIPPIHHDYEVAMKKDRTNSFSADARISSHQRPSEYSHAAGGWLPSDAGPLSTKSTNDSAAPGPYAGWSRVSNESPMTSSFSPYTANNAQLSSHSGWPSSIPTETGTRDHAAWSQQQRSVAYSNVDNLVPQSPYPPYHSSSRGSGMPDPYNTTITPTSIVEGSDGNAAGGAIAPGNPSPSTYPLQSQNWSAYTYDKASIPNTGGGYAPAPWYSQGPSGQNQPTSSVPYTGPDHPQYATGVYSYPPPPPR